MDCIEIKGLQFWAYHGLFESEQRQGQHFILDMQMYLDTACVREDLRLSVDYGALSQTAVDFCQEQRYDLLETLVNDLARYLLLQYPLIHRLTLTLHKPHAPINLPFADVSLGITRAWETCFLGLGSNLGDKHRHLQSVTDALSQDSGIQIVAESQRHETAPYGVTDQPAFLNSVLQIRTLYTPQELLERCQDLETASGRLRLRRWGERTLDVDILLYGNRVMDTETLTVPHPELYKRRFVLLPLCELAPNLVHPQFHQSLSQLLDRLGEDMP